jgi:citrate lyase subunit alpha/citrate CoA-transferase
MRFIRNRIGRKVPKYLDKIGEIAPYSQMDKTRVKYITERDKPHYGKVVGNLREAIEKVGLTDGMKISFHHHLRNGDHILEMVMKEIADMGFKDITICASSLTVAHKCLIGHIKSGVVTGIETSGIRGDLAGEITKNCILDKPVIFRTHGGRARAIERGDTKIDIAFVGAPCCDNMGNMNGQYGKSAFGSMGYAMVDTYYARKVVAITDNLVPYPAYPVSIGQTQVDYVVVVDEIGNPELMSQGPTRLTSTPLELAIAEYASRVLIASGLIRNGYSYQAGSGGISLAVVRFLKEYMKENQIKGSFASGGITSTMVELLEEGYFSALLDVQTFDEGAVRSIRENRNHIEMDAITYADPLAKGSVASNLDIMVLSATEVDLKFNVNVLTASDGMIMGALGGHPDTAAGSKLSVVVAPLVRKRIPVIVDEVVTVSTPGESVDVVVTERGIAVNPINPKLEEKLKEAGLPVYPIGKLRDMAYAITGIPEKPEFGDKIIGIVEYRDGTVLDVIKNIL